MISLKKKPLSIIAAEKTKKKKEDSFILGYHRTFQLHFSFPRNQKEQRLTQTFARRSQRSRERPADAAADTEENDIDPDTRTGQSA